MVAGRELGLPARLDDDRGGRLDDDRGPADLIAGPQIPALEHRRRKALGRLMRRARGHHHDLVDRTQWVGGGARRNRPLGLVDLGHAPDRLDRDLLDHERAALDHEAVAGTVLGLERLDHRRPSRGRDLERGIGAAVADVDARLGRDPVRGQALAGELGARGGRELVNRRLELRHQRVLERRLERPLAERAHIRKAHAVGREHARQGMHQHPRQAQRIGDPAGVLARRPAEAAEHVARDVVAALDRDLLDRIGHVVDRDREAAVRQLLRRPPGPRRVLDRGREVFELLPDDPAVERLVRARAEYVREKTRVQLADQDVGVGHGQGAALPVAGGAGIGAGRVRPDPEAGAVEREDRAAAGGDRVDRHHRRPHAHARDLGLEGTLVLAGVMRDVGRGAAHVEGDDLPEARERARPDPADDAAGRSREDRVLALEQLRVDQAAARLHEHQPDIAERSCHLIDVAPEDRRQIGIDHGRVAARDELHQGRHLMADRDLGEADRPRQRAERRLVGGVPVAMHQHDRERAKAAGERPFQVGPGALQIDRALDRAVGAHPLVDLDHRAVQELGQHDPAGEDVGPVLIADPERVAEAAGDREHGRSTPPLEQGVGRDRRAHLDRIDLGGRQRLALRRARAARECPRAPRRRSVPDAPRAVSGPSARHPARGRPRR